MVERSIYNFLNDIYEPPVVVSTVSKFKQYVTLPFFGVQSEKLKDELCSLIKFYPHININVVLINKFTIGS